MIFSLVDWRDSGEHMSTLAVVCQVVALMLYDGDLTWDFRYLLNIVWAKEVRPVCRSRGVCHIVQIETLGQNWHCSPSPRLGVIHYSLGPRSRFLRFWRLACRTYAPRGTLVPVLLSRSIVDPCTDRVKSIRHPSLDNFL
jgi:hypothetical protein